VRVIAEILMDCDAVEEGITVALAVAYASGGLSDAERTLIASLARAAGLPEQRLDALTRAVGLQTGGALV
jgi:tellurite resistance protein